MKAIVVHSRKQLLLFLFFIRMGTVTSYSILFSTLSLYLVDKLQISDELASDIVGIFVAFVYMLPLLGGILGNKVLPFRRLFIVGVSLQVLGGLILAYDHIQFVYWGLSFFLMGNMVSSTSINMLITQSYRTEEVVERKAAFLWNYSGMNMGFLLGYLLSGLLQLVGKYSALFACISAFSLMSVVLMYITSKKDFSYIEEKESNLFNIGQVLIIMIMLIIAIHFLLEKAYISKEILLGLGVTALVSIFIYMYYKHVEIRKQLMTFFHFAILSIAFWSIYMLTPTSLMLFIQDYVQDKYQLITIPPQWLNIVDAFVLVIFTPILAAVIKSLKTKHDYVFPTRCSFQLGFFIYLIGITLLLIATHVYQAEKINVIWIIAYMAIQALAEAFIGPGGYALIGDIIPHRIKGIATGMWIMTLGIASLIASGISNLAFEKVIKQKYSGIESYQEIFLIVTILALMALVYVTLIQKKLKKVTG